MPAFISWLPSLSLRPHSGLPLQLLTWASAVGFTASVGVFKCLDIKCQEKSKPCDPLKPGAAPLGGALLLASQVSLLIPVTSTAQTAALRVQGTVLLRLAPQDSWVPAQGFGLEDGFNSSPLPRSQTHMSHEHFPHIPPNHAALDESLTFLSLYFLPCNTGQYWVPPPTALYVTACNTSGKARKCAANTPLGPLSTAMGKIQTPSPALLRCGEKGTMTGISVHTT